MKTNTKIIIPVLAGLIGILLLARGSNETYNIDVPMENYTQEYQNQNEYDNSNQENQNRPMKKLANGGPARENGKVEMKKIVNPKTGDLMAYIPLPANWSISNAGITGPNGIIIKEYGAKMFDNAQRRPLSAQQILNQDLAPSIQQAGGKIVNTFPIPAIMKYDQNYSSKLYSSGDMQKTFDALGVDIVDPNGKPNFIIIRQGHYNYGYGGSWYYMTHTLECQSSVYDEAKQALIFGISNVQSNPDQIAAYNRNEVMKSEQSWAAHNTKMRNNQASFDARNRAYTASSNAALDASMDAWRTNNEISDMSQATWRNANASSDRMQDMEVNGIHEWENVYDPGNNTSYKVDSGYDRYFMNGQGEYFGTNDQFYHPGQDVNLNGTWNEVKRRGN